MILVTNVFQKYLGFVVNRASGCTYKQSEPDKTFSLRISGWSLSMHWFENLCLLRSTLNLALICMGSRTELTTSVEAMKGLDITNNKLQW